MTDTTTTKDEPQTDPQPGGGTGDDTTGHHEGNKAPTGTTVSPMGHHEGNSAPTGTTA